MGNVKVGKSCYIGSNSIILPEKEIGKKAIIGAVAILAKDVKESTIVVGVPAKEMKKIYNPLTFQVLVYKYKLEE